MRGDSKKTHKILSQIIYNRRSEAILMGETVLKYCSDPDPDLRMAGKIHQNFLFSFFTLLSPFPPHLDFFFFFFFFFAGIRSAFEFFEDPLMIDSLLTHLNDPHPLIQHTLLSHLLSLLSSLRSSPPPPNHPRYSENVLERIREREVGERLGVLGRYGVGVVKELARKCLEEREGVMEER